LNSAICFVGLAEASRKNIQMTEKWRAEKYLLRFVGLFPPGEHCYDDTKRYFSVIAFVQANVKLVS
jgi:hypothetical protein